MSTFTAELTFGPYQSGIVTDGTISYRTIQYNAFTPANLFGGGDSGVWYDPSDNSTLKQNSNGTGAVALNDPVGYMANKAGGGSNATVVTAGLRPLWKADGNGKNYLEFDGTDDHLDLTCFDATVSTMCVAGKLRAAGAAFKAIFVIAKQIIYGDQTTNIWGTNNTGPVPSSFSANTLQVMTLRSRAANDVDLYTNTTKETSAAGAVYNTRTEVLGAAFSGVYLQFADLNLYGAFAINRVLTDVETTNLITYMQGKI